LSFAHEELRLFPINDEQHVRRAIQTFSLAYLRGGHIHIHPDNPLTKNDVQMMHDNIFEAAKKFNILTAHHCDLCEERVILT
jgi:hypothetical protein